MRRSTIFLIVFVDLLGYGLILPVLPFAGIRFGATPVMVGMLASIFPLLQMLAMPLWGRASDRFGRRKILVVSSFISILTYILFAFSHSFAILFLSRSLAGVTSANMGVAKAYLADISPSDGLAKNMARFGAAQALGFLIGPALGMAFPASGTFGIGMASAGLSAVAFLFALFALPETRPAETATESLKREPWIRTIAANPALGHASLALFLVSLAFSHLFIAFPLYLRSTYHFGSRETGLYFILLSFIGVTVQGLLYGKLVRIISASRLLNYGLLAMTAGMVGFTITFLAVPSGTAILVACVAIGYSLAYPGILSAVATASRREDQGLSAGISESASGLARTLGPFLAGFFISVSGSSLAFLSAAFATVVAWIHNRSQSGLRSRVATPSQLTESFRQEMFALFQRYYSDVTYSAFRDDLAEKNFILIFDDRKQPGEIRLAGFSTILRRKDATGATALFSGDTVVHEDYWGSKILPKAFSNFLVRSKLGSLTQPVYWMLISKGYKTYLLMRNNFPVSFPNHRVSTPARHQAFKNHFYSEKYGTSYDPASSRIRFTESHGAVRGKIAVPGEDALADPEIRFFVSANPGYIHGDELACVAEIRIRDIAFTSLKYVFRAIQSRSRAKTSESRARTSDPRKSELG